MIRICNVYFPSRLFLFIVIDATILLMIGLIALTPGLTRVHNTPSSLSIGVAAFTGIVLLWVMYLFDLYDLDLKADWKETFLRCLRALGCAILLMTPAWVLLEPRQARYQEMELGLLIFIALLCLYRPAIEWIRRIVFPGERLLLLGNGRMIDLLSDALAQRFSLPIRLSAVVHESSKFKLADNHFAACGSLDQIDQMCDLFRPHRVAVAVHPHGEPLPPEKLIQLRRRGIRVENAESLYEALSGRVPVNDLDARSLAYGDCFRPPTSFAVYRFFGQVFAALIAVVLLPLLGLIALAIVLDSSGPVFYRQERVGMDGKPFQAVKFRSMRVDAEATSGAVWAQKDDPRVTPVGRIVRKLRFDEFAQLWNVVRGEMCLVGPRPERPMFTSMLNEHVPYYDVRHSVPPGITGWAQVNADYGASVDESRIKLEYDLFYLKNASPLLDTMIIFKTIKIALFGRGAR